MTPGPVTSSPAATDGLTRAPRRGRYRRVEVVEVVDETEDARTLVLRVPAEFDREFAYRPGQYVTVRVPDPPAGSMPPRDGSMPPRDGSVPPHDGSMPPRDDVPARCYSLSSCPGVDELPRITVKRTPGGYVSNWLCDHVAAGNWLDVLPPAGRFTPRDLDGELLLVAGGSGITPVMSILKAMLTGGRGRAVLVYANRSRDDVIFARDLAALQDRHPGRLQLWLWLDDVQGPPTPGRLRALLAERLSGRGDGTVHELDDRDAYVCGPGPFMDVAVDAVRGLGLPSTRVHVERFDLLADDPAADAAANGSAGTATTNRTAGTTTTSRQSGDATTSGSADPADRTGSAMAGQAGAGPGPGGVADAGPPVTEAVPGIGASAGAGAGAGIAATVAVTRNGRVHQVAWPAGARLLDVLIAAGLNPPYSCRQGRCGACACRISSGEVELAHNEVLEEEDFADSYILACQAVARTPSVEITYD